MSDNGSVAIYVTPDANEGLEPPVITDTGDGVSGTAVKDSGATVDLYCDAADEARFIVALEVPVVGGAWSYGGPVEQECAGQNFTATVNVDGVGTSNTSAPVADAL